MADFIQFIKERRAAHGILQNHYASTLTDSDENLYGLYWKLKLPEKINKERADKAFTHRLKEKFPGAMYVMENWSTSMDRYRKLIWGLDFRCLLKNRGFNVFLINEFKTSKTCFEHHKENLQTSKMVQNSTPRRSNQPRYCQNVVSRHELLRYP